MSHVNVELHEKYPHERIEDSEHQVVREELAAVGLWNTALTGGVEVHLPRGAYFCECGNFEAITAALVRVQQRLGRTLSAEITIGESKGFGLKPVIKPATPYVPALPAPRLRTAVYEALQIAQPSGPGIYSKALPAGGSDWANSILGVVPR